jgi:hypothetical protein
MSAMDSTNFSFTVDKSDVTVMYNQEMTEHHNKWIISLGAVSKLFILSGRLFNISFIFPFTVPRRKSTRN